jgi:hypothetical protein
MASTARAPKMQAAIVLCLPSCGDRFIHHKKVAPIAKSTATNFQSLLLNGARKRLDRFIVD